MKSGRFWSRKLAIFYCIKKSVHFLFKLISTNCWIHLFIQKSLYQSGMLWFQYCVIDLNIGENRILAAVFLLLAMSQKTSNCLWNSNNLASVFTVVFGIIRNTYSYSKFKEIIRNRIKNNNTPHIPLKKWPTANTKSPFTIKEKSVTSCLQWSIFFCKEKSARKLKDKEEWLQSDFGENFGIPECGANSWIWSKYDWSKSWCSLFWNKYDWWKSTRWRIQRSYKIREYFLVMKRLIWEYAFYQELLLRTEAETRALNSKSQKSAIINLQDKQLSVFPIFFVSV